MRYFLPIAAGLMAVTAAALPFATIVEAQTVKPERVQFAKGKTSKVIKGTLTGDQSRIYLVNLRAGQTVTVKLLSTNSSANFNVTAPGAMEAMFIGSVSGNEFSGVVPSTGDYKIDLFLMRSAARRRESMNFTIAIGATG